MEGHHREERAIRKKLGTLDSIARPSINFLTRFPNKYNEVAGPDELYHNTTAFALFYLSLSLVLVANL